MTTLKQAYFVCLVIECWVLWWHVGCLSFIACLHYIVYIDIILLQVILYQFSARVCSGYIIQAHISVMMSQTLSQDFFHELSYVIMYLHQCMYACIGAQ